MSTESFKAAMRLSNGEEEIRSFQLQSPFEYEEMVSLLKSQLNLSDVKIKAADEDNELVTLTSTSDLSSAYKTAKDRNSKLKVWVYAAGPNGPRPLGEDEKVRPSPLTRSDSTTSESGLAGMTGTPKYVPRKDREVTFVDPGSAKKKVPFTPTNGSGANAGLVASPSGSLALGAALGASLSSALASSPSTEFNNGVALCMEWLNDGCPLPEGECTKTHALSSNWRCKNCNQTGHRLLDCPTKVCSYYAKTRTCRRGDKCPLSHDVAAVATAVLPSPRTMRADQARDWRDKEAIKALGSSQSLGALSGIPRHPATTPKMTGSASNASLNWAGAAAAGSGAAASQELLKVLQMANPEALTTIIKVAAQALNINASSPSTISTSASPLSSTPAQSQAPAAQQVAAPGGPLSATTSETNSSTLGSTSEGSPKTGTARPRRTMASYANAATGDITSPTGPGTPLPTLVKVLSENTLRKTKACRHWTEKGHCKLGDSCNFRHDPQLQGTGSSPLSPDSARPVGATTPRVVCKFFQSNACRNGTECRFLHTTNPNPMASPTKTTGDSTPRRSQLSPNATAFTYPYDSTSSLNASASTGSLNGVPRCELCSRSFNSAAQKQQHEGSKQHQLALIKTKANEVPIPGACENCHDATHSSTDCKLTICGRYVTKGLCPAGDTCPRDHIASVQEIEVSA